MKHIAALEAKTKFGELLDTAQREPVTIQKHGRDVAVIISIKDYEDIEKMKQERFQAEIQQGLDDVKAGKVTDGNTVFENLRKLAK